MTKKMWIVFVGLCAVLLGGLVWLSTSNRIDVSDLDVNTVMKAEARNGNIADHVYGTADSKVILIEYADFQCPGCAALNPKMLDIKEKYKDVVTFIYRNMPLVAIHPNAKFAVSAVEAAGLQGKYREMSKLVFESQSGWESASATDRLTIFTGYAEQVGVGDITKFKADIEGKDIAKKITFDQALASKANLKLSTPTLVLNGKVLTSDQTASEDTIKAALNDALKANGLTVPQ